ncbi:AAA family ATPase [Methylomonas sp. LL1]|uniref:AAA domain-containing protein n=1 Tax=Methylomonas sp. LL1 TaxID=2785785 RepID=UPI0018C3F512|nr:AAA domain-containing protein [Methylomonas sp. LL1]QPK62543.1 AAA family ATPase [Methylomonas sp. LL1]
MKESNQLLIDLLDYIEQVEKLNRKPVYTVPSDIFEASQSDLKGLPGIDFNIQSEHDDVWLRITRLKETPAPEPSDALKPWVIISKSPDKTPILKDEYAVYENKVEVGVETLEQHPEIQVEFDSYINTRWEPWSFSEKPRRKTISFYNKLFAVQQTISSDSTDSPIEIAWGIGCAVWSAPESNRSIKYPLVTQTCEIYLNPKTFDIEIRPRDLDPRLELSCYEDQENHGVRPLVEFWKSVNENAADRVNPFEASTFEGVLKAAVLHLDANGSYLENQPEPNLPTPTDKLIITDTWVLFGRKRSEHIFIQDIERLKKNISDDIKIPAVIEGFVKTGDSVVKPRESVAFRGLSCSDARHGLKELYFPMPYNDEQVSIIEKLETNDGVVVQGPPGTGKTHTIANVICHYLAQGKSVLVTASGESALSVLQEKLPPQIKPLSVALLTDERDGRRQFEYSIQEIASSVNSLNPTQSHHTIQHLEEQLNGLHAKIASVDQAINSFAEKHMKHYPFHGKEVLCAELAKFVLDNQDNYDWLEDEINSKHNTLRFSDDDIKSLRKSRADVAGDIIYLDHSLPVCDAFPEWSNLSYLHNDLVRASNFKDKVDSGCVIPLSDATHETFEEAKKLLEFLNKRHVLEEKVEQAAITWSSRLRAKFIAVDEDAAITHLLSLCDEIGNLDSIRKTNLSHAVAFADDSELNEDFMQAIQRLSQGKSPFKFFGSKEIKQLLVKVTVMGLNPKHDNQEAWQAVVVHAEYLLNARKLLSRWNVIGREIGLDSVDDNLDDAFRLLARHKDHIDDIKKLSVEFDRPLSEKISRVFGHAVIGTKNIDLKQQVEAITLSLSQHLDRDRFTYAHQQATALFKKIEGHSGAIVDDILQFLHASLGHPDRDEITLRETWYALMSELNRLNSLQPALREIQRVSVLLTESGATKWAHAVISTPFQDYERLTAADWLEAWNWRAAKTFIEHIDGHQKLKKLFDERHSLEKTLSKTYQELIAEKTWLGVYNNSPNDIRQALQAYLNAIQSMGSGNGIRAVRFRQDARAAMQRAYKAVPCWILPQWRVSETIPPEVGLFDLVVIDEASQSDIWALPALLRGKKLLVVGDHKQVSPSTVGTKEVKIQELRDRFLRDQPHGSEMTPGKSIYDLARVVFAGNSVMLKEHFRCVHAIIEFSNREFYDGQIKPLRVPKSSERLDPPLIDVMVIGGYRKGDNNPPEARAIVNEIKEIIADPEMAGRTIGVVTLLGNEQANHIWNLINTEISQAEIVERMISVGAPPVFQGRERDIMLVSNVLAKGDKSAANRLEIEQRFNVALSRARDRMYLFRSIDENELKPDSLTAKVFRHFKQPFIQDAKQVSSLRELCESDFEREIFDLLVERNYRVKPQVRCGAYRIDFVVEGSEGRRLAVECDGDKFHGPGQWMNDMTRQRVLERAGWTFWRCFASSFVMRRQEVFDDLLNTLYKMGIDPLGSESVDNSQWVCSKVVDPYQVINVVEEDESEELAFEVKEDSVETKRQITPQNEDLFADNIIEDAIESAEHRKLDIIELSEIQEAILTVLANCPNQSCTIESIGTRVLKQLEIITRGKPRVEFEKKVSKALGSLIRKNKVEKYKAKNERIRLQDSI